MTARFTYDRMRDVVGQLGDEDRDLLLAAIYEQGDRREMSQPRPHELAPVKQPRRWTVFTASAYLTAYSIALTFLAVLFDFKAKWIVFLGGIDVVLLGACVLIAMLEDSRRMKYWMRGMVPPDR